MDPSGISPFTSTWFMALGPRQKCKNPLWLWDLGKSVKTRIKSKKLSETTLESIAPNVRHDVYILKECMDP